jgi:hypothetical protein
MGILEFVLVSVEDLWLLKPCLVLPARVGPAMHALALGKAGKVGKTGQPQAKRILTWKFFHLTEGACL